jgi:hypothetical protein
MEEALVLYTRERSAGIGWIRERDNVKRKIVSLPGIICYHLPLSQPLH